MSVAEHMARLYRVTALLLAVVLLAGCASREVYFTSSPVGAEVMVGKRRGITPCTLKVPEGVTDATFISPSGEEMAMPLPEMDGDLDNAAEFGGKVLGGTIMVVGASVALIGVLGILAAAPDNDYDEFDYLRDSDKDEWDGESAGIGFLMLLGGGAVCLLGGWIYPDDDVPELRAEFSAEE